MKNVSLIIFFIILLPISEFNNSDYDALWDGKGGYRYGQTNGDDPVTFTTIASYQTGLLDLQPSIKILVVCHEILYNFELSSI